MIIKNGTTDVTTYFVLRDSTNHVPKTDITVTDIDLYYVEDLAAISAKIDCTALGSATAPHADGGAYHVGKGLYRIDWPDAAFDGGVGKRVQLIVECTGSDMTFLEVELSPQIDAADVADAVWDEALSGHLAAGSAGNALNGAGSASDPWSTALPGSYGAGTAGKIIGDNINAPIATVGAFVDAIKAKTDNLPAAPAASGGAMALTPAAVDAILDETAGSFTVRQILKLIESVLSGKTSGGGSDTLIFRDAADTKDVLTVTVDGDNNRTAVARDLT